MAGRTNLHSLSLYSPLIYQFPCFNFANFLHTSMSHVLMNYMSSMRKTRSRAQILLRLYRLATLSLLSSVGSILVVSEKQPSQSQSHAIVLA